MTFVANAASVNLNARLDQTPGGPPLAWYSWGLQVERGAALTAYSPATVANVDKTAAAASQVNSFFGTVATSDITVSVNGSTNAVTTSYAGPSEWSYRRFILHYARLCAAINSVDAGAVDAFLIGSELKALMAVRDSATNFPGVAKMKTLAADVKPILGAGVKVSYAADWSDFNNYNPGDGSGDLFFHLDPLWSDANIDFIGVDLYAPLSDWRDGTSHLDPIASATSIYDLDYLRGNVEGGKFYDWYYADAAARDAQGPFRPGPLAPMPGVMAISGPSAIGSTARWGLPISRHWSPNAASASASRPMM